MKMTSLQNHTIYTISEFEAQMGLTSSTLRYYENEGLIKPHRYENGRRYYTEDDVLWVKFINHLKGTGMTIGDLKQYIDWREQGDQTIAKRLKLLKKTKNNFLERFKDIQHHLQILNDKINWYEAKEAGLTSEKESFADYLKRLGHQE